MSIANLYHLPLETTKTLKLHNTNDLNCHHAKQEENNLRVAALVFTRPFPKDWGMAEDHGAPEVEKLSEA